MGGERETCRPEAVSAVCMARVPHTQTSWDGVVGGPEGLNWGLESDWVWEVGTDGGSSTGT